MQVDVPLSNILFSHRLKLKEKTLVFEFLVEIAGLVTSPLQVKQEGFNIAACLVWSS